MLNYMEMERYISAIAKRADLRVEWGDSSSVPSTNGKVLKLPRMTDSNGADDAAYSNLLHYATHEVDHVLYSDMVGPPKYAPGVDTKRSLLGAIWNATEDARIEYQGAKEFEGDRLNSNTVYKRLMGDIVKRLEGAGADIKQSLGSLLTFVNESYADIYPSAGLLAADLERVSKCPEQDKLMSGDYLNVLRNVREIVDPVQGTRATYELSKRIFEEVFGGDAKKEEQRCEAEAKAEAKGGGAKKNEQQASGQEKQEGSGSGGQEGEEQEGEGQGQGQGEGSDQEGKGQAQAGDGDGEGDDGEDGNESDKAKAGNGKKGKARSKFQTVDYSDYMMDAHTKGRPGAGCHIDYSNYQGNGAYQPATKNDYSVNDYSKTPPKNEGYATASIKSTLACQSTGFANRIRTILQIRDRDRFSYGTKSGKLHNPNLHRVMMKDATGYNQRVFKKKHVNNVLDAAVTLLVDQSGSMSGGKYDHAAAAAAMLNETIGNTLHIPVEVISFTNSMCGGGRWMNDMYIHRSFTDKRVPNDNLIQRMGASSFDMNSNSDGDAIMFAFDRLIRRPEKRKLLVVFSDGSPAGGNGDINAYTKRVVKAIETDSPVDIVGIGIMDANVKRIYKECQVIHEVSELEKALLNVVENKLK